MKLKPTSTTGSILFDTAISSFQRRCAFVNHSNNKLFSTRYASFRTLTSSTLPQFSLSPSPLTKTTPPNTITKSLFKYNLFNIPQRKFSTSSTSTNHSENNTPSSSDVDSSFTTLKARFELPVIDFISKEQTGNISVSKYIFNAPIRVDILHKVVRWQLAKRRQGTHKAKTKSEVSGTNRKPWRQKGTGRARAGSRRAPQFKGGAAIFPPTPRSHAFDLPKKVRAFGLRVALSTKLQQGRLHIVENTNLPEHKTKQLVQSLPKQWGSVLIITGETVNENLKKASRNLYRVDVIKRAGINVYDILSRDTLVLDMSALDFIEARFIRLGLGDHLPLPRKWNGTLEDVKRLGESRKAAKQEGSEGEGVKKEKGKEKNPKKKRS
eukprot:TRINITY_DN4265_c0_g2_i1.p1 TRINITY_DN4265_c0_g2~~TRINITY_DN4265_c0_g2_i1.p1  ORF type:complete len:423 (-),score=96.97 TRINITY_DN4265_c0_g2_i1:23-1162(-)